MDFVQRWLPEIPPNPECLSHSSHKGWTPWPLSCYCCFNSPLEFWRPLWFDLTNRIWNGYFARPRPRSKRPASLSFFMLDSGHHVRKPNYLAGEIPVERAAVGNESLREKEGGVQPTPGLRSFSVGDTRPTTEVLWVLLP